VARDICWIFGVPTLIFSCRRLPVFICPIFPSFPPIIGKFKSFLSGRGMNWDIEGKLAPAAMTAYRPRFLPTAVISSKDFSLISEMNFIGDEFYSERLSVLTMEATYF
jgi:hypothetical protein